MSELYELFKRHTEINVPVLVGTNDLKEVTDALKKQVEYEDIGLTPAQLLKVDKLYTEKCKELGELKKKLLPFLIGDKAYCIYENGEIKEKEVIKIIINETRTAYYTNQNGNGFYGNMIGNTVFSTREAAETALAEMEVKHET
ncbi:MAG: hypothetical protein ACERKN_07195 [Velocimicrobium sp.]